MPSFDVVSDFDSHEARNGVDQANREVTTRFDFKGTGSKYELDGEVISLTTQSDFQLKQMMDILQQKLSKRGIDIGCLDEQEPEFSGSEARQKVIMRRGIDIDRARKLVKQIKAEKMKVQAAIQGDKLRVNGKKRDDLQAVIAMLKDGDIGLPLAVRELPGLGRAGPAPDERQMGTGDSQVTTTPGHHVRGERTSPCAMTYARWARWSAISFANRTATESLRVGREFARLRAIRRREGNEKPGEELVDTRQGTRSKDRLTVDPRFLHLLPDGQHRGESAPHSSAARLPSRCPPSTSPADLRIR